MKKDYNIRNGQKGITLVALVVTIVVLLILAGITINTLLGDNGILKKAKDAANKMNEAVQNDTENLNELLNQIDNAIGTEKPKVPIDKLPNGPVNGNTTVTDTNDKDFTVPDGFEVKKEEGTEVDKGIVIEDKKGNQFVWVPVPDPSTIFEIQSGQKVGKLYDFTGMNSVQKPYPGGDAGTFYEPDMTTTGALGDAGADGIEQLKNVIGITGTDDATILKKWKEQLQIEFDKMIASVQKYKGFYIGRYSTGNLATNTSTEPVVKKGQTTITSVNWYYMYQNTKKIANGNNGVTTSMIWGCQWDRTLQWLVDSKNKTHMQLVDSTSWGNFSGSIQPTGNNTAWKANNIYDLTGNVWKWTMETSGIGRTYRGGDYSSTIGYMAAFRGNTKTTNFNNALGSVSTLIINP